MIVPLLYVRINTLQHSKKVIDVGFSIIIQGLKIPYVGIHMTKFYFKESSKVITPSSYNIFNSSIKGYNTHQFSALGLMGATIIMIKIEIFFLYISIVANCME